MGLKLLEVRLFLIMAVVWLGLLKQVPFRAPRPYLSFSFEGLIPKSRKDSGLEGEETFFGFDP
jgi:hypothetical protein